MASASRYRRLDEDELSLLEFNISSSQHVESSDKGIVIEECGGRCQQSLFQCLKRTYLVHVMIIMAYMTLFWHVGISIQFRKERSNLVYSPAGDFIKYEERMFETTVDKRYVGSPSPMSDCEWSDLLQGSQFRASEEDLKHLGRRDNAVMLPNGDYVVMMNVFHELHCLKNIRQWMYPEYYYPNITEEKREALQHEADHCLDYLRQAIMCHGDVGISTLHWKSDWKYPVSRQTAHECVNWELIDGFAKTRQVNMMEKGLLVHPQLGPPWPDGPEPVEADT